MNKCKVAMLVIIVIYSYWDPCSTSDVNISGLVNYPVAM